MNPLSPEDKQRIYEEEKIRLQAQEELRLEIKKKADETEGKHFLIACVIVGIAAWFIWDYISDAMAADALRQINSLLLLL